MTGFIDTNNPQTYLYTPATNVAGDSWAEAGDKSLGDSSDEENWAFLPDQSVLSYEIYGSLSTGVFQAERYIPTTGQWVDASALSPTNPPSVLVAQPWL